MARLQLRAQVVLPGLLLPEDTPAPREGEGVDLPVEVLPAGGDPGLADTDLGRPRGESDQEVVVGAEHVGQDRHGQQSALK